MRCNPQPTIHTGGPEAHRNPAGPNPRLKIVEEDRAGQRRAKPFVEATRPVEEMYGKPREEQQRSKSKR